jgi:hypothetical protein
MKKPIIPLYHPWQEKEIRKGLEEGRDLDEMEKSWQKELERFLAISKQYLLY